MGFAGGSGGKESDCNAGDPVSIPGSGRSPGEGNGYPLQYSSLEKLKMKQYIKQLFHINSEQLRQ